jgi:hypothetical protein
MKERSTIPSLSFSCQNRVLIPEFDGEDQVFVVINGAEAKVDSIIFE